MERKPTQSISPLATSRSTFSVNHLDRAKSYWPISQHQDWSTSPIKLHVAAAYLTSSTLHAVHCQTNGEGHDGILLVSRDSTVRRCFPILATYVGDYPEQTLVTLVKTGNCPICPASCNEIGDWESNLEPHNTKKIIEALNSINIGAAKFTKACAAAGIKPVQCIFWKKSSIYRHLPLYHTRYLASVIPRSFQAHHLLGSGCMWRCGDQCSVPLPAPKSPHPTVYEKHF